MNLQKKKFASVDSKVKLWDVILTPSNGPITD